MKKYILLSLLALTALTAVPLPSKAAGVYLSIGEREHYYRRHHWHRHHGHWYRSRRHCPYCRNW